VSNNKEVASSSIGKCIGRRFDFRGYAKLGVKVPKEIRIGCPTLLTCTGEATTKDASWGKERLFRILINKVEYK